jgi:K(+)-stimulated pyrophosphate-energized sodium pump
MNSVGKAAMDMVYEVRRQFRKFLELWKEQTGICKMCRYFYKAALREMMLPGILTIDFLSWYFLGNFYGDNNQLVAEMLGGYMAGVTVSGVLWAVFSMPEVLGIMPRNLLKLGL